MPCARVTRLLSTWSVVALIEMPSDPVSSTELPSTVTPVPLTMIPQPPHRRTVLFRYVPFAELHDAPTIPLPEQSSTTLFATLISLHPAWIPLTQLRTMLSVAYW